MAPWPETGNEPKAPDKDDKRELVEVVKIALEESSESSLTSRTDQVKPSEEKEVLTLDEGQLKALLDEAITYKNPKDREGKSELFKELLQEAEADETDSKELTNSLTGKLPRGYYNLPARKRHSRHQGKECGVGTSNTRGGSLQNLHALGMEGGRGSRSRRNGRSGETLVSARQREGGSLPTNVNADNENDLDMICPNYTSRATLEVTGPRREEKTSAGDSNPQGTQHQGHSYLPNGPEPNTSRPLISNDAEPIKFASSICVGPVESGAMLYSPSPVQHVSVLSIPPQTTVAACNTEEPKVSNGKTEESHVSNSKTDEPQVSNSSEHKKPIVSRNRRMVVHQVINGQQLLMKRPSEDLDTDRLIGRPFDATWCDFSSYTVLDINDATGLRNCVGELPDSKTKSLDENGNALGCLRVDSNCSDRKKPRRVKAKNDRNVILSDDIEGFRGGADIDTLMEYIESTSNILDGSKGNKTRANQTNGPRNHVKVRAKEEDSRSIKRRTKEKFQRCNSLEEISKTKLEDLTEESSNERVNGSGHTLTKKQVTLDDAQLGKKSSWDEDTYRENNTDLVKKNRDKVDRASPDGIQDSEFHVVTKKQRKKKRRAGCSGRVGSKSVYYGGRGFPAHDRTLERDGSSGLLYQYRHGRGNQTGSQPRRKSASSVPPSDKSDSSDLDSVHSLPVSSTTTRTKVGKNSVSGGSTPQASYADIARTMASPPDIGSQGKYSPGPDCEMSSSDPIPILLPAPIASSLIKKDAMTDTNCDTIKPALPKEEYPPLEIKNANLVLDATVKLRCASRDDNVSQDKVSLKTVPDNFVIPDSESGDAPSSTLVDAPASCIKSPLANSISKRPPVILMGESMVRSQVATDSALPTDFTFGFEVNEQLLRSEDNLCNLNNNVLASALLAAAPSAMQCSPRVPDSNLKRLIQYVAHEWNETMKDLAAGRAKYYEEQ